MACYYILYDTEKDFYAALKDRNKELLIKMIKCVLSAIKRRKDKVDIFEITFKDTSILTFTIDKPQYNELLRSCLEDMIKYEEYELCAEIVKIINKKVKKPKELT